MTKKRVGILGGTFNPVHLGHLVIAEQAYSQLNLDKVLFMPDFIPPHVDTKSAISAADRVVMVKLAIANNNHFGIEMAEIDRQGKSYTYDTMLALTKAHPDTEYFFIIGGDMVAYLPKWYHIDELEKLVNFVGVKRLGSPQTTDYAVQWISVPYIELSSTFVREAVKTGYDLKYLVPQPVLQYIEEHHLYE